VRPTTHIVDAVCAEPHVFEPRTRGSYCTWGYVVLAEVVKRVTRDPVPDLARRTLFEPLGLQVTQFGCDDDSLSHIVPIFGGNLDRLSPLNQPEFLAMFPGDVGGYSNARDVAVICQMMLNGGRYGRSQVLSPVTVQRMIEKQFPWTDTPNSLSGTHEEQLHSLTKGLGWHLRDAGCYRGSDLISRRAFTHGGALGMRAIADPDYGLMTVFMTSAFAASPAGVSAAAGPIGQHAQVFGTLAASAITTL
jgi:CubicO group peptidase (beta-lactamase class C family)